MKSDHLPWRPVEPATVQWSERGEPVSTSYGDRYFSEANGPGESAHVFLRGSGLPQRWRQHPRTHFCIGETGFGTGLNFLLTWQAWRNAPSPRPDLHYVAFEKHPLSGPDLARALALWPELAALSSALLDAYPGLLPGQHRIQLDAGRVRLDLWWGDALESLRDLASREQPTVDAWYLDGFAPACNADMWTSGVLAAVAALSLPATSVATFTAAGQVRRGLQQVGFQIEKSPGYGRKRECLRGAFEGSTGRSVTSAHHLRWDITRAGAIRPASVLVLGGGLAGCTTAAALARRGVAVTLLEQRTVASGGSAIDQGILYTRLSRERSAQADFAIQSFQYASAFYRHMFASGQLETAVDGELCGSFQQHGAAAEMRDALLGVEHLARSMNPEEATAALGIEQSSGGFWFPRSGWLHPIAVCRALLAHPHLEVIENCGEVTLDDCGGQWCALANGRVLARADCAVVATGPGVTALQQLHWLRVQSIRGQSTLIPVAPCFNDLRAVLCHEGYIAPTRGDHYCIGATFQPGMDHPSPREEDHRHNLDRLSAAVPAWRETLDSLDPGALRGHVGYRCASPDYLPAAGPVPDVARFLDDFAALRNNARAPLSCHGQYLQGLYVNTAHGSRGLTSTPLAAELLASMICQEPPPVSRALSRALAPARFIIRDLSRNRI